MSSNEQEGETIFGLHAFPGPVAKAPPRCVCDLALGPRYHPGTPVFDGNNVVNHTTEHQTVGPLTGVPPELLPPAAPPPAATVTSCLHLALKLPTSRRPITRGLHFFLPAVQKQLTHISSWGILRTRTRMRKMTIGMTLFIPHCVICTVTAAYSVQR